ncbi:hypothetical protein AZE42_11707, partial [Rhizopogon vesiculosus]
AAEPLQPSPFQRNADLSDVARPAPTCTPKKAASVFPGTLGQDRASSAASRARSTTQSTQATPDIDRDSVSPVADEFISTVNEIQDATYVPFARPPIMSPRLERFQNIVEPGSPPIADLRNFSPSPSPSATFSLGSKTTSLHTHSHSPPHSRTISGGTPISYGNPPQKSVPPAMPSSSVSTGGRSDATSARKSTNSGFVSVVMDDSILPSDRVAVLDALGLSDDDDKGDYSNGEITNDSSNSPRLIEVDDPSHIYVMNDVESSLNDGQASFHDISRSPPTTDTSPPRTQPSGTQTSQQSSLAPSFPEPNTAMSKTGPPQATSIISDNSDHHSPGCRAHPIESVEDKIRRLTPPQFLPLINQLLLQRSKGNMRPTRRLISNALREYDEDVYKLAGVSRFGSYASQAQQASLIELGGQEGQGEQWISLHPNLFKDGTTTKSVPDTTTQSVEEATTDSVEEATIESVENKIRRLTPPQFLPLINQLLLERSKGNMRPTRRSIANALKQYDKDVYKRAGVTNVKFGDYASQAQRASLIELGGQDSQGESTWIALHPNLFKDETTPESIKETTIQSVEETTLESKIRHLTPPKLLPLINQLLLERSKGNMRPTRNFMSNALKEYDKDVYKRAGVSKFGDYASQAQQASLIVFGGRDSDGEQAWIALHPSLFKDEPTAEAVEKTTFESEIRRLTPPKFLPLINQLLLERSKGNMRPTRSFMSDALKGYDEDVYKRAGVNKFGEYVSQAQQASLIVFGGRDSHGEQAWIALHPNLSKDEPTAEAVEKTTIQSVEKTTFESKVRRLTPPKFLPLINQLLLAKSQGSMNPTRRSIAKALMRYDRDVYKRAGVDKWGDYVSQAQGASLIKLGGREDGGEQSWIALHPNLFKEETTIESVEDKIRRLTPPQFLPLIEQLLQARSKGDMKPGMYSIAFALLQCDKDAYKRAGVNKFGDYASLAERASLIELGGSEGEAWIALHPKWFKK